MPRSEKHFASLKITDFSFPQISSYLQKTPFLILPVGGIEPVGEKLSLGVLNTCCDALAGALSEKMQIMVAPLLAYGATIPFKSFEGSAGVHPEILTNFVVDCCKCWFFHGIKRIMVLTLSMDAGRWGKSVVNRLADYGGKEAVRLISLQEDKRFRSLCGNQKTGNEFKRSEWGIAALTAYLDPSVDEQPVDVRTDHSGGEPDFERWYRRGRDPEKLRNLAPSASFSVSGYKPPGATVGETLFKETVQFLTEELSPFFAVEDNASR